MFANVKIVISHSVNVRVCNIKSSVVRPRVGLVSPEDYKEDVNNSIRFTGDTKELNQELIAKMEQAAADLEFEKAVFIEIGCLYFAKRTASRFQSESEADILAIAYQAGVTVQIMHVRNGRMLGGKSYFPDMLGDDLGQLDFMATLLSGCR